MVYTVQGDWFLAREFRLENGGDPPEDLNWSMMKFKRGCWLDDVCFKRLEFVIRVEYE